MAAYFPKLLLFARKKQRRVFIPPPSELPHVIVLDRLNGACSETRCPVGRASLHSPALLSQVGAPGQGPDLASVSLVTVCDVSHRLAPHRPSGLLSRWLPTPRCVRVKWLKPCGPGRGLAELTGSLCRGQIRTEEQPAPG